MTNVKTLLIAMGAMLMTAGAAYAEADCTYKGGDYSDRSTVCQSGREYRCDDGKWAVLSTACSEDLPAIGKSCLLDGTLYSPGSATCQSGTQYRCKDGAWGDLAITCTASGDTMAKRAPAGRTCMYNGATVATESTICKSGVTFRCQDGDWHNIGSACQ